ncbi:ABC transporter substrate-binding protein [Kutzneria viridogrisea]|uniref:Polar amino acid transport system substrate-binding protein n=1 Tax=Kutzneria viridogrisea TaxID=47990 RepID=A0ABR6BJH7_9PSEU|nr:polar amino acid transport system substrate-binding protein [Kutzneria viridogrisea]
MTRLVALACALLALTACGTATGSDAPKSAFPTQDVVSQVARDPAVSALLPEDVRRAGSIRLATAAGGTPPSAFYAEDNRTLLGQDVDIADAVARVLGVRLDRQVASFEAILPALGSGKFAVGTGNFGVTTERLKTIDFVTYVDDGQGFAVRGDSPLGAITDLTQLCGKRIGTGAGTTFEATLERERHRCADSGRSPYEVQVFAETSALYLSLQQGRVDVLMSTINGLRYAVSRQPNLRFLNEFHRLDVGFAFAKGSPLTAAFQAAVNKLIADGTYDRVLGKWGTRSSALDTSRINPPERA